MLHNFTYIQEHLVEWSLAPYITAMGFLFWPTIFSAIIGYVYMKNQSAVSATVAALILFGMFGNILMHVELWISAMQILVALIITGLVLVFLTRMRR